MTHVPVADLFARIAEAARREPAIEGELLADFDGTLERRFGVTPPTSGRLERRDGGFRLTYGGRHFNFGDPRASAVGELSDLELELVTGGGDSPNCVSNGQGSPAGSGGGSAAASGGDAFHPTAVPLTQNHRRG